MSIAFAAATAERLDRHRALARIGSCVSPVPSNITISKVFIDSSWELRRPDTRRYRTGTKYMKGILDDLRHGLRVLVRSGGASYGTTAAAVISLALGIGANTTIFTFVNAL